MNRYRRILMASALSAVLLAGCGPQASDKKEEPMPMENTVYGEQIKQMNRITDQAKKLEQERMPNLNQQLKENEQ